MKKYIIIVKEDDEELTVKRINNNFNGLELIGILERIQLDIIKQMERKPDISEGKAIIDGKAEDIEK